MSHFVWPTKTGGIGRAEQLDENPDKKSGERPHEGTDEGPDERAYKRLDEKPDERKES